LIFGDGNTWTEKVLNVLLYFRNFEHVTDNRFSDFKDPEGS